MFRLAPSRSHVLLVMFVSVEILMESSTAQPLNQRLNSYTSPRHTNLQQSSSLHTLRHVPPLPDVPRPATSTHSFARRDSNDPNDGDARSAVNYYFIFIAVFVLFVIIALWGGRRRQQKRKAMALERRQSALQQDANGWPISRRWLHGRDRTDDDVRGYYHNEEGLDARGEAPPPYRPAGATPAPPNDVSHLTVPPPAAVRDSPHKPPDYQATVTSLPNSAPQATQATQSESNRATSPSTDANNSRP